jgi:hypothetical protein
MFHTLYFENKEVLNVLGIFHGSDWFPKCLTLLRLLVYVHNSSLYTQFTGQVHVVLKPSQFRTDIIWLFCIFLNKI